MIPLRPTLLAVCAVLALGGCQTARMEVTNSLTERGFVATRDLELGQVLQWLPEERALLPIAIIDRPARQYDNLADLRVRFETGVSFSGGVRLSPEQQADLETEVAARTSTVLENATTRALENITSLVIEDWRARPEIWRNELGISDRGWPEDDALLYVAVVYKQTLADRLHVQVDKTSAAEGEFTSSVRGAAGNIRFRLVDAASLELIARERRTPVFYDLAIIRIRNTEGGPRFSQVRDPQIRQSLSAYIARMIDTQ